MELNQKGRGNPPTKTTTMERTSVGSGRSYKEGTIQLRKANIPLLLESYTMQQLAEEFDVSIGVVQLVCAEHYEGRQIGFSEDVATPEDELNTFGAWDELKKTELYKELILTIK